MTERDEDPAQSGEVVSTSPQARMWELNRQAMLLGEKADAITVRKTVLRDNVQARAQYDAVSVGLLSVIHQLAAGPPEELRDPTRRDELTSWVSGLNDQLRTMANQLQSCLGWSVRRCPFSSAPPPPSGGRDGVDLRPPSE